MCFRTPRTCRVRGGPRRDVSRRETRPRPTGRANSQAAREHHSLPEQPRFTNPERHPFTPSPSVCPDASTPRVCSNPRRDVSRRKTRPRPTGRANSQAAREHHSLPEQPRFTNPVGRKSALGSADPRALLRSMGEGLCRVSRERNSKLPEASPPSGSRLRNPERHPSAPSPSVLPDASNLPSSQLPSTVNQEDFYCQLRRAMGAESCTTLGATICYAKRRLRQDRVLSDATAWRNTAGR
jgi:hypothetical protein